MHRPVGSLLESDKICNSFNAVLGLKELHYFIDRDALDEVKLDVRRSRELVGNSISAELLVLCKALERGGFICQ